MYFLGVCGCEDLYYFKHYIYWVAEGWERKQIFFIFKQGY